MNSPSNQILLSPGDPSPVGFVNSRGASPFLLLGDHAGNRVPGSLGTLGISDAERCRHIGWDIGIAGLGAALSERLDATFMHQIYSRLVIDCNRAPDTDGAMPPVSDGTVVPANQALTPLQRTARIDAIHTPYHAAIADTLAARAAAGQATILVSLHSFTPAMGGIARPWQIGLLYSHGDARFAHALRDLLIARGDMTVGDNEPYAMDEIDYTVPRHAFAAGLRYVEIEIRQDLLDTPERQAEWSDLLAPLLIEANARTR